MKKKNSTLFAIVAVLGLSQFNPLFAQMDSMSESVMAIRDIYLKDDVDHEAFESFYINEVVATNEKCMPGVKMVLLKGDRGRESGMYKHVWMFESVELRNYYWPQEGGGGGDGLGAAIGKLCEKEFAALNEAWDMYWDSEKMEAGPSPTFTDFVVMRK